MYKRQEEGIEVANSLFDKAAGRIHTAANKYAIQMEEPVLAAAIPGRTKIPLPSMPPILIAIAEVSVTLRLSFFKLSNFYPKIGFFLQLKKSQ